MGDFNIKIVNAAEQHGARVKGCSKIRPEKTRAMPKNSFLSPFIQIVDIELLIFANW